MLIAAPWVLAQSQEAKPGESKPAEASSAPVPKEESSVTDHTIQIGGQSIAHKATAGTILLKNDRVEGERRSVH
jgi:carboxypeptidase C (cathepsin A)